MKTFVMLLVVGFVVVGQELPDCPPFSEGLYPDCECVYDGMMYNKTDNSCPNPDCPELSIGSFPDCNCTSRNFDYSLYLNECFRVCPDESSGYWPNCQCEDGAGFDKNNFQCGYCTSDTVSGIYPNCVCEEENARFNPDRYRCQVCPDDSSGIIPNCKCNDGSEYDPERNECKKCPEFTTGIHPNCICGGEGGTFDGESCRHCPSGEGVYPNCQCYEPFVYNQGHNTCSLCKTCFNCPDNSTGIYPDCHCENGVYGKSNGACIECPSNSFGLYPNCDCTDKEETFSAYINQCYIICGDNSTGLHPDCRCDRVDFYYDIEEKLCKSIVGRKCPEDSIGIGPDCLCMDGELVFSKLNWECHQQLLGSEFTSDSRKCANGAERWPQCNVMIDQKLLITLIG